MLQIPYSASAYTLRLEFPGQWNPATVASVKISVADLGGTSLLSATTATRFTTNTQSGALSAGGSMLTLTTAIGAGISPTPGDRFWIAPSSSGPGEMVECLYYDATNKYIYLTDDLRYAHATGTSIYGAFVYYAINVSTTTTFIKSLQMVVTWQPYNSTPLVCYPAITERAEISSVEFASMDLENRFSFRYQREYRVIEASGHGFQEWATDAKRELEIELFNRGLEINRIVDQTKLEPLTLSKLRHMVTLSGGDDWTAEREAAFAEYQRQFNLLVETPIWGDKNQDGIEDDSEVDDYGAAQLLNSERGI